MVGSVLNTDVSSNEYVSLYQGKGFGIKHPTCDKWILRKYLSIVHIRYDALSSADSEYGSLVLRSQVPISCHKILPILKSLVLA